MMYCSLMSLIVIISLYLLLYLYFSLLFFVLLFFFFKQKTAYEMRISDWSSDVCSSDLLLGRRDRGRGIAGDRPRSAAYQRHRGLARRLEIGRASCRERVCQYV